MNDNTQKLLDALRSGEYKQGRNQLRVTNPRGDHAYCCLGVACDISGLGEWYGESRYIVSDTEDASSTRLPIAVMEWLGWSNRDGTWSSQSGAIGMNDTGEDFAAIADAIEANFDGITSYGDDDAA